MRSYVLIKRISILCLSLFLSACNFSLSSLDGSDSAGGSSRNVNYDVSGGKKIYFDWNEQPDEAICEALGVHNNQLTIGVAFIPRDNAHNRAALDAFEATLTTDFGNDVLIINREERLSIINIELIDCFVLSQIRSLPQVEFIEPKYVAPIDHDEIFDAVTQLASTSVPAQILPQEEDEEQLNPAFYSPESFDITYDEYIRKIEHKTADIMKRHRVKEIYDSFKFFGSTEIGVAVMDNGILPEREEYFLQSNGNFELTGHYSPFNTLDPVADGPYPQTYDLFGITQHIDGIYHHGTRQTERVYMMAPNSHIVSVRASPIVFWFQPSHFKGVTNAILALAEDPKIRIISSSMGTVFHVHEIERAIDYFNAFDKLYISAAGTSLPLLKDFVKVVFPANLESTISTTGLTNTEETNGKFVLGYDSHGGKENDFVVDHSKSSSESVSSSAGMFALVWSANPALTREQMIDILIKSSSGYKSRGKKDPVFGWGKIDLYQAFKMAKDKS